MKASQKQTTPGHRQTLARKLMLRRLAARSILFTERLLPQLLWPLSVAALFLCFAWFGLYRPLHDLLRWGILFAFTFAFLVSMLPLARLRWPSADEADRFLEERNGLEHQPIGVQEQSPATDSPFARALWKEHQARMAARIVGLETGLPRPDVSRHDPWGLRSLPALLLVTAFAFSHSNSAGSIADAFRQQQPAARHDPGLRIDAWVTPPAYTGKAPVFLTNRNPSDSQIIRVPQFSTLTIRISGGKEKETVALTPAGNGEMETLQPAGQEAANNPTETVALEATRNYEREIDRNATVSVNGEKWDFEVIADTPPRIAFDGMPRRSVNGALEIGFTAGDDYGIREAKALIEPLETGDGAATPLYPLPDYRLDLPRQNGKDIKGLTSRNISDHPLAGKPVRITLIATDGQGQTGRSPSHEMILPGRNFSEPLAASVAEERQVFALDVRKLPRAIELNEALAIRPEETVPDHTHFLLIRSALSRMKQARDEESLKDTAAYLWEIALGIEDGNLSVAERRLRDAQKALDEALERNAPDEEIAKLMEELREAMQEFMSELAQRMQNAPTSNMQAQNVLRQRDLQNMMDQIENLARSGNRDAARQMLSELQRMMNNLQAGRPQRPGQQQQQQNSQMRQQIDRLGEILQQQQRLMDETFRLDQALRDRMQWGDPQQQNDGNQQQQGEGGQPQSPGEPGNMTAEQLREALKQLRERQDQLGKQLGELQKGLGEMGIEPGENFGKAQQEMQGAGEALGEGEGERAVQGQGNALNALRQGAQDMMNSMMQAMGQQGEGQQQGQGQEQGMTGQGNQNGRDPLGRQRAPNGPDFGDRNRGLDEVDVQRTREILEAIREKLGNSLSPEMEKRYLERLLDLQ